MALNLLVDIFLATLLCNAVHNIESDVNSHSIEAESINSYEAEFLKHSISNCDSQPLPNAQACSSPWTYCDNGTCKCADTEGMLCFPSDQPLLHAGYCVTFNKDHALTQLGQCV